MCKVVQFPHPGPEYNCEAWHLVDKPRNPEPHRRRFVFTKGMVRDKNGAWEWIPVTAWVEWEANAKLYKTRKGSKTIPKHIHLPYLPASGIPDPEKRHATDPCVFGDRFFYTVCRQNLKGNPTKMQSLEEGSVILFGSSIKYPNGYHFVLDTLFTVSRERITHSRDNQLKKPDQVPDWYFKLTLEQLYTTPLTYTLMRGYTPEEQPDFFSWVPCKPCRDRVPLIFERPIVNLNGLNPRLCRNFKCIDADPREAWNAVVEQVKNQGLELCARLEVPGEQPDLELQTWVEEAKREPFPVWSWRAEIGSGSQIG